MWITVRFHLQFCNCREKPSTASHFYRNQEIARYELGRIPDGEHLLSTREGWQKNVAKWTTGRRITYLGSFAPQGVDYYWVAGKSSN